MKNKIILFILLFSFAILPSLMLTTGCGSALGLATATLLNNIGDDDDGVPDGPDPDGDLNLSNYGKTVDALTMEKYTFVASREDGVLVVNSADPVNLSYVTRFPTEGEAVDLFLDGNYLYVACISGGLYILDITRPEAPVLEGRETIATKNVNAVHKSGNYAYWTGGDEFSGYFYVTDVSDTKNPKNVGSLAFARIHTGMSIWVDGSYAYVGDSNGNMYIINISNPTVPVVTTFMSLETKDSWASGITKSGNNIFLSNWKQGLNIIDVTTVQSPEVLGVYTLFEPAIDCEVDGNFAYVAFGSLGLVKVDIAVPSKPKLDKTLTDPKDAIINSVCLYGDYVFSADNGRQHLVSVKYK